MRLATRPFPPLRRLPVPDLVCLGLWGGLLAGLHVYGGLATSDVGDAFGVVLVGLALGSTWLWHAEHPLQLVSGLAALLGHARGRLARLAIKTGFDLRGEPPIVRGIPPLLVLAVGSTVPAAILLAVFSDRFPDALRSGLSALSPALWILALGALWVALVAGSILLFCVPLVYVEALSLDSPRWGPRRRRVEAGVGLGWLAAIALGTSVLPGWTPLAIVAVAWSGYLALSLLPGAPDLTILWKPRHGGTGPAALRWSELAAATHVFYAAAYLAVVLALRGDPLHGPLSRQTPITAMLGLLFAWAFAGAYALELLHLSAITWAGRTADPARPVPPRVLVQGGRACGRRERKLLRAAFRARGWEVAFDPRRRRPTDVAVVVVREGAAHEPLPTGTWPLFVGPEDLGGEAVWPLLARRDEILRRRALLHGLRRIFKSLAVRDFDQGSGFWIAPHLWFVTHVSRDVDDEEGWFLGPSYRRAIPLPARSYFRELLASLGIDLVFVEDGVRFRRFKRLLAMLFEYHDIFGGERAIDERHLTGLPGIRAILHEFELDQPLRTSRYPEPDYEDLGRARILHVFRDRGEDEEQHQRPRSFDSIFSPRAPVTTG